MKTCNQAHIILRYQHWLLHDSTCRSVFIGDSICEWDFVIVNFSSCRKIQFVSSFTIMLFIAFERSHIWMLACGLTTLIFYDFTQSLHASSGIVPETTLWLQSCAIDHAVGHWLHTSEAQLHVQGCFMWNLWWIEWHWDRIFSEAFNFLLLLHISPLSSGGWTVGLLASTETYCHLIIVYCNHFITLHSSITLCMPCINFLSKIFNVWYVKPYGYVKDSADKFK